MRFLLRPWSVVAAGWLVVPLLLLAGSGSAQTVCSTDAECDDGNVCTIDACDTALGCQHQTVSCDDGNTCTNQICDPFLGCLYDRQQRELQRYQQLHARRRLPDRRVRRRQSRQRLHGLSVGRHHSLGGRNLRWRDLRLELAHG